MKWPPIRLPGDILAGTGFRADVVVVLSCEVGSAVLNGVIEVAGEDVVVVYGEA
jgi:hypothetical protein